MQSSEAPKITSGEVFTDGLLEQVRGGQLLLWRPDAQILANKVEHDGETYAPVSLQSEFEAVLPAGPADFGAAEGLVARIADRFGLYLDVDQPELLATWCMGTWLIGALCNWIPLNICGPLGTESLFFDLAASVCRRPLRLVAPSITQLVQLPVAFSPTLMLQSPSARVLQDLLAATCEPDVKLLRQGRIINLKASVVVFTREPIAFPAVAIRINAAKTSARISRAERLRLQGELQPQLLAFRLNRFFDVANSNFDVPRFSPKVRVIARALGAIVEGTPEMQARIQEALGPYDEQARVDDSQDASALIIETLLAFIHEGKGKVSVFEITQLVNALLVGRHEKFELSARAVGSLLRSNMGFLARRHAAGYELLLNKKFSERVHAIAHDRGVLSALELCATCSFCQRVEASREDVHDVHEAHDVHLQRPALDGNDDETPST